VPAYLCAKLAHDCGVATMIAGDGGDEIFAGNKRYAEQQRFAGYARLPRLLRCGLIEPLARALPLDGPWLLRKARRYVDQASLPLPDRLEIDNPLNGPALAGMFADAALAAIDPLAAMHERRAVFAKAGTAADLKRMLRLDLQITLADNDIRKVRRTCELAGVGVRFPFLDDPVVELAARVPSGLLINRGELRSFYKTAFRGFLADATIAKKKHGFGMPFAEWLGKDPGLRALALDCLARFGRRGYLRTDFLDRLGKALGGDGKGSEVGGLAWDITMLELWLQSRRIV
jgi:asparagine synthase (glutamine-hydrolysing)